MDEEHFLDLKHIMFVYEGRYTPEVFCISAAMVTIIHNETLK